MNSTTAVALLVKTPGHSPVKTRLAEAIGTRDAHDFHRLSARATAESLLACTRRFPDRLTPYWAVAERAAAGEWEGFPIVEQGEGSFHERLGRVYETLRRRHGSVILAATDSPEVPSGIWLRAWRALQSPGSVIGPAADGGFYLMGSNREIPLSAWESLPLSTPAAAQSLARALEPLGALRWLSLLDDIDHAGDLERLTTRLAERGENRGELGRLCEWTKRGNPCD
jgi:uncharacterized protein